MMRRSLAVVLVTCGLLTPAAASQAAATSPSGVASPTAAALPRVAPAPDGPTADRCAPRSKQVKRLTRRLRTAETKRGKARVRRQLNASRRSLKRCRAHKKPAPGVPAPAPSPAPTPPPASELPPVGPPEPGQPAIRVNGGADGVYGTTTPLTIEAVDFPPLPDGSVYHIIVRTPLFPRRPFAPEGCHRYEPGDYTFTGTATTVTIAPQPAWCVGDARASVWVGAPDAMYGSNLDVAHVTFKIALDAVPTAAR